MLDARDAELVLRPVVAAEEIDGDEPFVKIGVRMRSAVAAAGFRGVLEDEARRS